MSPWPGRQEKCLQLRNERASVTHQTRAAPARFSSRAHSDSVDPVVMMSSTTSTVAGRPVADAPAVADGQIITGRGPGAAITFALAVLAHLVDEDTALSVAEGMVTTL